MSMREKIKYKLFTISLLLFMTSLTASPATTLEGIVKSYTGSPIANANIKIFQGEDEILQTNSDAAGVFSISDLASGVYEVVIFKEGYQGERSTVDFAGASTKQIDQVLFPLGIQPEYRCDFETAVNFAIERGTNCDGSFERTSKEKRRGEYGGQLNYDFTQSGTVHSNRYVGYIFSPAIGGIEEGDRIGMWVKANGPPYRVQIRILDKNNEVYQSGPLIVGSEDADWTFVSTIPVSSWGHWGGDQNGKIDYPIRIQSIVIDKSASSAHYQTAGAFFVDDIMIISPNVKTGTLAVHANDGFTGLPLAGVSVSVYDQSKSYVIEEASTGFSGSVLFEDFPAGNFWVEIKKAGYKTVWQQVLIKDSQLTTLSADIVNRGGLQGRVFDSQNLPLANALVSYRSNNGEYQMTFTFADGSFNLQNIESGIGQLVVFHGGFKLERKNVECLPGESFDLGEIKLSQASDNIVPDAVSGSATADLPLTIKLTWTTTSSDVGLFLIYRATEEHFQCSFENLHGVCLPETNIAQPGKEYEFIDQQFITTKTYYYAIIAVDLDGNSSQPFYLAKKPLPPYSPAEPENETGAVIINQNPIFSWQPVEGALKYRLELARQADFEEIAYVFDNIPNFVDEDNRIRINLDEALSEGKWWWRVCAVFPSGVYSAYTEASSFNIVSTKDGLTVPYFTIFPEAIQPRKGIQEVKVCFVVARTAEISLKIFNRQGKCVKVLLSGETIQGVENNGENEFQEVIWDGKDSDLKPVPNGLYYIQLTIRETGDNRAKQIVKRVGVFR